MSKQRDLEYEKRTLVKVSFKESGIVRSLAGILSGLFVVKILLDFIPGFKPTPDGIWLFVQITIVLYYWSWFLAALKGIEIQSLLLNTTGSSREKMPFSAYFALAIGVPLGVAAMALVLYKDIATPYVAEVWGGTLVQLLVFVLAAFWIWDMVWHWSVRQDMRKMIDLSKENMLGPSKKYFEQEQLYYFEEFIFGNWRIWRILFGTFFIGTMIYLSIFINEAIKFRNYIIGTDSILALLTFVFVVVSETWIWIMRHRLLVGVKMLEKLGKKYNMSVKQYTEIIKP